MLLPAPFSFPFALVDTAVAVLMSVATSHHTNYSPHSVNTCSGTGAHDWQLPPGATESFFEVSARLNATATSPFAMCKSYVLEWRYGITIAFLFSLLALFQLVICSFAFVFHYRDSRRQNQSFWKPMYDSLIIVPKILYVCTSVFVYHLPAILFRCLPLRVKAKTRYARRCVVKTGEAVVDGAEVQLDKLTRKAKRRYQAKERYQGSGDGEPTPLSSFLGIYDILMLVVEDLHYTDIVNLSLASKSVREAVLPADDYDRRIQHFRMYTCDSSTKMQCWVCNNQLCDVCSPPFPVCTIPLNIND